jgi:pimeloyl-ACP methyl ester carboxylesterase
MTLKSMFGRDANWVRTVRLFPLTAFLLVLSAAACDSSASAQSGVFPAGEKHLYIYCEGQRQGPAVVLDAGLFRDSTDWKLVVPDIAKFTQVCDYDREGLGKSTIDKVVEPESECIDESAEDIRLLLKSVHVPPPYVLVGASGGGIRVRR